MLNLNLDSAISRPNRSVGPNGRDGTDGHVGLKGMYALRRAIKGQEKFAEFKSKSYIPKMER